MTDINPYIGLLVCGLSPTLFACGVVIVLGGIWTLAKRLKDR